MSRFIIEATLTYTLVQFSNIIYLVLGKTVNSFNNFKGLTFTAGIYETRINQKKLHFLSPFTEYLFIFFLGGGDVLFTL